MHTAMKFICEEKLVILNKMNEMLISVEKKQRKILVLTHLFFKSYEWREIRTVNTGILDFFMTEK